MRRHSLTKQWIARVFSWFLLDPEIRGDKTVVHSCNNCYMTSVAVLQQVNWRKMSKVESWLLLMHQIPPKPDSLRVRVWRALQKIGALQLKSSVYILPSGKENQDRFQTVIQDIL